MAGTVYEVASLPELGDVLFCFCDAQSGDGDEMCELLCILMSFVMTCFYMDL